MAPRILPWLAAQTPADRMPSQALSRRCAWSRYGILLSVLLFSVLLFSVLLFSVTDSTANAQAVPTASRAGDLQVGAGFAFGNSNYLSSELGGNGESLRGFDLYSTFDPRPHWGAELNFRQTTPSYGEQVYERNYEVGGRYVLPFERFKPYAKAMYGRGVFNYPKDIANIAYNLYSLGTGVDLRLTPSINLRVDYEHQHWFGFPLQPLAPNIVTIGVGYHFSGAGRCSRCAIR